MKKKFSITCLVLLSLCTGCWPARITTSPGASGIVLDSETHAPIGGATVVVSRSNGHYVRLSDGERVGDPPSIEQALTNSQPPQVVTDDLGRFSIRSKHKWIIYVPIGRLMPARGTLVIRREGYRPDLVPLSTNGVQQLASVLLMPSNAPLFKTTAETRDIAFHNGTVFHIKRQDGETLHGVCMTAKTWPDLRFECERARISEEPDGRHVSITLYDAHVFRGSNDLATLTAAMPRPPNIPPSKWETALRERKLTFAK
jgi:hypothetical protein